jgi:hypothetical protein
MVGEKETAEPYRENPLIAENQELRNKIGSLEKDLEGWRKSFYDKDNQLMTERGVWNRKLDQQTMAMKDRWLMRAVLLLLWLAFTVFLSLGVFYLIYMHLIPPNFLTLVLLGVFLGLMLFFALNDESRRVE